MYSAARRRDLCGRGVGASSDRQGAASFTAEVIRAGREKPSRGVCVAPRWLRRAEPQAFVRLVEDAEAVLRAVRWGAGHPVPPPVVGASIFQGNGLHLLDAGGNEADESPGIDDAIKGGVEACERHACSRAFAKAWMFAKRLW